MICEFGPGKICRYDFPATHLWRLMCVHPDCSGEMKVLAVCDTHHDVIEQRVANKEFVTCTPARNRHKADPSHREHMFECAKGYSYLGKA